MLLNSLNSEDIVPGYAFFLGATVCFFLFLRAGPAWLLALSAVLFALATLFHWTMMVPGLAAFGIAFLMAARKDRVYLALGAGWLILFLCVTQALVLLAFPSLHIPIWAVVLPGKANAGGWVGFQTEKLIFAAIGIGNYFSGGYNVSSYPSAFQGAVLKAMIVSWAWFLAGAAACVWALARRKAGFLLKCWAAFALAAFFIGEAGDLYSQPQDPQMQIQPMFATMAGFVILLARWGSQPGKRRIAVLTVAGVIAGGNGAANLRIMEAGAGRRWKADRRRRSVRPSLPERSNTHRRPGVRRLDHLAIRDSMARRFEGLPGWKLPSCVRVHESPRHQRPGSGRFDARAHRSSPG